MRSWFQAWKATAVLMLAAVLCASARQTERIQAQEKDPETLLRALGQLRFDLKRTFVVRDLNLKRDAVTLTFERGKLVFLEPVGGVVTGLLFWGQGTALASPPARIEKQQLSLFTGSPTLSERFTEAFIRFTDDTHAELMSQIAESEEQGAADESSGLEAFQLLLKREVISNYRVLADLLDGRTSPMFAAKIVGRRLGIFDFGYDRRKTEDLFLGQFRHEGERAQYDGWCSFSSRRRQAELERGEGPGAVLDVRQYRLDVEIDKSDTLRGTAELEFRCEQDGAWMVTLDLSRFLKVTKVTDQDGRSLRFFQNTDLTSEEISKLGHDVVLVLFREGTRRGGVQKLTFNYAGDVISRVGSGVFYVGSRGSWYPNLGTTDRARYEMKFRHPKPFTIVATGDLLNAWEEADIRHTLWRSDTEIPVAGFNYGDYERTLASAGSVRVEVYANRGIENVHQEVIARVEYLRQLQRQQAVSPRRRAGGPVNEPLVLPGPNLLDFDTTRFAKDIADQVGATLAFYEPFLGKYPYKKLAVSQIPGRFSQGWPSLLYASSLSFFSPSQRAQLGLDKDREAYFLECIHAHEIAHQWWGNMMGWQSYHDLWMFEGFSNYLGYLSLKAKYPGGKQFEELMRFARERLQEKGSSNQPIESAGPVWLGFRLNSSKFSGAYRPIIYEKGAWILHMLRYLFSNPATGSDEKFKTFMREFATAHEGQLVSTKDFQQATDKYVTKALDLEGNKKLDWFFDQWVYDTGIPTYRLQYSLASQQNGTYLLKGKILQERVPEYFMMPVEVFGHFGPNRMSKIGSVVVSGNETSFRFTLRSKPLKVTLDENHQILCENKTL